MQRNREQRNSDLFLYFWSFIQREQAGMSQIITFLSFPEVFKSVTYRSLNSLSFLIGVSGLSNALIWHIFKQFNPLISIL